MNSSSTHNVRPARWHLLSKYREAHLTRAEWTRFFAGFPPEDFPLVKIVGSRADIIRCPETDMQLEIYVNVDGSFSALFPTCSELDNRFDGFVIDGLTIEDLRLYRLDWPALCREVALNFGLTGQIRDMPDLRWFWRLGDLHTNSHQYAYFLAVIREDPDADIVAAALKSNPLARLIVPSLSDPAFHRLAEAKIKLHVLADGMPSHFPDALTLSTESVLVPSGNETPLALAKKLNSIEDKTDRVLKHVAGVPSLVEKVDAMNSTLVNVDKGVKIIAVIPTILAENEKTIRDQNARMAFLQQAITSSVRTALEAAEQKIVKRQNDLCLRKLTEEELLLFLFLIGYRWKREHKKVFSKRKICWVLGLSDPPHPEIVSRKQAELENAHPEIKNLIAGFRALNAKGETREKHREISYNAMDDAERRRLGLDDAKEDDQ